MNNEVAKPGLRQPPVHYMSSLITLILDNLWGLGEVGATATGVGILGVPVLSLFTGISCFIAVCGIQHFIAHDSWGAALAKALVMGIIAGVPYQVSGTAVGGLLLGWSGLSGLSRALIGGGNRNKS